MTPKEQLVDFVKEGCLRAAVYFKTTLGLPEEMFFEQWDSLKTLGEQMNWLNNMYKEHPKVFEGMPVFKP